MTYRTFEHTADIGLEVEAANLNWAFAEAALGLTTVITGGNLAEPVRCPAAGCRGTDRWSLRSVGGLGTIWE